MKTATSDVKKKYPKLKILVPLILYTAYVVLYGWNLGVYIKQNGEMGFTIRLLLFLLFAYGLSKYYDFYKKNS